MILIADSGSTKTDWCVANNGTALTRIHTQGINPFLQNSDQIENTILRELLPELGKENVEQVWFYGAGLVFNEQIELMCNLLNRHFPNAKIGAGSDLNAAARALCGHRPGIACIMGTGSNSCCYDGKQISAHVSPLGFILGDEGSGSFMGRQLLSDYLKKQIPESLSKTFAERYPVTPAEILDRVYKKPFPNRFLASFAPFLSEHICHPYIHALVKDSFIAFFRRNIMQYPSADHLPVHFVGSVAIHLSAVLKEAANQLAINMGQVAASPMDGLIRYHSR